MRTALSPSLMLAGLLLAAATQPAPGADHDPAVPPLLQNVDIEQKLGAQIPLDLEFLDENSRTVKLRDYFGKRPVILTLNYYGCPMLCGLQLNQMLKAMKEIDWQPGQQYEIVTVSFDPFERPELARQKKQTYLEALGRPEAGKGWHFLTGNKENIRALTQTVGFKYRWDAERQEWAHAAALILITPDGKVSRYLGGLSYEPKTLRLSLVEAGEGKVGSLWDAIFLWCYHYDASTGKYTPIARRIMFFGGVATVLVLGMGLTSLWLLETRRRRQAVAAAAVSD